MLLFICFIFLNIYYKLQTIIILFIIISKNISYFLSHYYYYIILNNLIQIIMFNHKPLLLYLHIYHFYLYI